MKSFSFIYIILAMCTLSVFIVLGAAGLAQSKLGAISPYAMRHMAEGMSTPVLKSMLAMEVPHLRQHTVLAPSSPSNAFHALLQFVVPIERTEPWTIIASEVPGLATLAFHEGTDRENTGQEGAEQGSKEQDGAEQESVGEERTEQDGIGQSSEALHENAEHVEITIPNERKVFIYHSHNRESWVPELEGVSKHSEAFDEEINVTLLGARLAERLERQGIGALSSDTDYTTVIHDYNWNFSYAYSLKTVQEAYAVHPRLEYFFDIHRDAQSKHVTTATIDGQSYAKVYFVIGRKNPEWEKNEALAQQIHELLERDYPGISRGILGKTATSGHAEYNQSFSANSILIEIGGVENTLEESYRTIDALAEAIGEVIWQAAKE